MRPCVRQCVFTFEFLFMNVLLRDSVCVRVCVRV